MFNGVKKILLETNLTFLLKLDFNVLKFIYSEKATKFCEIFPLLLTTVHTVKSRGKISQNFVAFSEYMNFNFANLYIDNFFNKVLKPNNPKIKT